MSSVRDKKAAAHLTHILKALPEDLVEKALEHGRGVPQDWRQLPLGKLVWRLRKRFGMTQRQLGTLAGLPHSKVAKIEGGQDIQVSTLCQLFAGFGCGLVFLPVSHLRAEQLWHRTHNLSEAGHIPRRQRG